MGHEDGQGMHGDRHLVPHLINLINDQLLPPRLSLSICSAYDSGTVTVSVAVAYVLVFPFHVFKPPCQVLVYRYDAGRSYTAYREGLNLTLNGDGAALLQLP